MTDHKLHNLAPRYEAERDAEFWRRRCEEGAALQLFGARVLDIVEDAITDGCFECDAEAIADEAVRCGLMKHEPYDPAKHTNLAEGDYDPGQLIYWWGE